MNIYTTTITLYLAMVSISYFYIEKLGLYSFLQVLKAEPAGLCLISLMIFSILYVGYYKYIR